MKKKKKHFALQPQAKETQISPFAKLPKHPLSDMTDRGQMWSDKFQIFTHAEFGPFFFFFFFLTANAFLFQHFRDKG